MSYLESGVRERRSIISWIDEVFIAEDDGDDLVSILIEPLFYNSQIGLQSAGVQLVAARVTEVDLVLVVVCFAFNCDQK